MASRRRGHAVVTAIVMVLDRHRRRNTTVSIAVVVLASCSAGRSAPGAEVASARPPVKCTEDSPERRGEEGCTILANRPLEVGTDPVYWHLDRFDTLSAATHAAGGDGVAVEAHGAIWLMTVEARTEDHHGSQHVAWIGPLELPHTDRPWMRVQSSLLMPGTTTPVHTHAGPEAIYVVDGEQCMETPAAGHRLAAGRSHVVPGGGIHRGRVIGTAPRRAFGLIIYDPAQPASHDLDRPPTLASCR